MIILDHKCHMLGSEDQDSTMLASMKPGYETTCTFPQCGHNVANKTCCGQNSFIEETNTLHKK